MLLYRKQNDTSLQSGTSSIFGGVTLASGNNTAGSTTPFANFSFGGTNIVTKSDATPPLSTVQSAKSAKLPREDASREYEEKQLRLANRFNQHVKSLKNNVLDPIGIERYLTTYLSYRAQQYNQPSVEGNVPALNSAEATEKPASSVVASTAFKSNPFLPTTAFTLAPTPASTFASKGPTGLFSAPASSPFIGFNFGTTPSDSTVRPSAMFGGFSTTPTSAVVEAAAGSKDGTKHAPFENAEEDEGEDPENNREELARASNDKNVEVAYEASNCNVFRFRRDKSPLLLTTGVLKLQRNKITGQCSAVVVRLLSGLFCCTIRFVAHCSLCRVPFSLSATSNNWNRQIQHCSFFKYVSQQTLIPAHGETSRSSRC
jgi:hypothetical protein